MSMHLAKNMAFFATGLLFAALAWWVSGHEGHRLEDLEREERADEPAVASVAASRHR